MSSSPASGPVGMLLSPLVPCFIRVDVLLTCRKPANCCILRLFHAGPSLLLYPEPVAALRLFGCLPRQKQAAPPSSASLILPTVHSPESLRWPSWYRPCSTTPFQ